MYKAWFRIPLHSPNAVVCAIPSFLCDSNYISILFIVCTIYNLFFFLFFRSVWRKRAFFILTQSYKELARVAFAGRIKEVAAFANAASKGDVNIVLVIVGLLSSKRKLYDSDLKGINSVMQVGDAGVARVGIEKLTSCLEVLQEAIDFSVPSQVPDKKTISVRLNSEVTRHHEFLIVDFD